MRVIKTDDVLASFPAFTLDTNQFLRIDVITVLRRIRARVSARRGRSHHTNIPVHLPEKHSTALVWVSFLSMTTNGFVVLLTDFQHE